MGVWRCGEGLSRVVEQDVEAPKPLRRGRRRPARTPASSRTSAGAKNAPALRPPRRRAPWRVRPPRQRRADRPSLPRGRSGARGASEARRPAGDEGGLPFNLPIGQRSYWRPLHCRRFGLRRRRGPLPAPALTPNRSHWRALCNWGDWARRWRTPITRGGCGAAPLSIFSRWRPLRNLAGPASARSRGPRPPPALTPTLSQRERGKTPRRLPSPRP